MKNSKKYILLIILTLILSIPNIVLAEDCNIQNFGSIEVIENGSDNNYGGNINYYSTKNNNTWSTDEVTFKVKVQAPFGDKVTKIKYKINSYDVCSGTIEGDSIASNSGSVTLSVTINKSYVESMTFSGVAVSISNSKKISSISGEKISVNHEGETGDSANQGNLENLIPTGSGSCNGKGDLIELINKYWKWVVIVAPALLIIMGTVDFLKSMGSGDADAIKKNTTNFIKRTVATILILMLPTILNIIFGIFGLSDKICL